VFDTKLKLLATATRQTRTIANDLTSRNNTTMEIKKDDRLVYYRRVAIGTGSFLLMILGVTLLGMSVFSPQNETKIALQATRPVAEGGGMRALIGSHEAQASDGEMAIGEHLDTLADTLERVVNEPTNSGTDAGTAAEAGLEEARDTRGNSDEEITITLNKKDLETAAEAGVATVGIWRLVWDAVWPKLQSFGSALTGIFK